MKKILTLKKNYEFSYVLNKGKSYYGNQIIVYISKNKKDTNILGIAINTKLGKASKKKQSKKINQRKLQNNYKRH